MTSLEIYNFQCLEHVKVEIEGITLVIGRSNAGKSSICRAAETLFYSRPGDSYIRHGATSCGISLTDDSPSPALPNAAPLVLNRTKDGRGAVYLISGVKYEKTGKRGHMELLEPLGIREYPAGSFLFRPNLIRQFDPLFLIGHTPSVAFTFLSYVMEESKFNDVLKFVAAEIKTTSSRLNVLEGMIKATQDDHDSMFAERNSLALRSQQLFPSVTQITQLGAVLESAEKLYGEWDRLSLELISKSAALQRLSEVVLPDATSLRFTVSAASQLCGELSAIQIQLASISAELTYIVSVPSQEDAVNLLGQARSLSNRYNAVYHEVEQHSAAMLALGIQEEHVNKQRDELLAEIKVCPFCSSGLTAETTDVLLHHLRGV